MNTKRKIVRERFILMFFVVLWLELMRRMIWELRPHDCTVIADIMVTVDFFPCVSFGTRFRDQTDLLTKRRA